MESNPFPRTPLQVGVRRSISMSGRACRYVYMTLDPARACVALQCNTHYVGYPYLHICVPVLRTSKSICTTTHAARALWLDLAVRIQLSCRRAAFSYLHISSNVLHPSCIFICIRRSLTERWSAGSAPRKITTSSPSIPTANSCCSWIRWTVRPGYSLCSSIRAQKYLLAVVCSARPWEYVHALRVGYMDLGGLVLWLILGFPTSMNAYLYLFLGAAVHQMSS